MHEKASKGNEGQRGDKRRRKKEGKKYLVDVGIAGNAWNNMESS